MPLKVSAIGRQPPDFVNEESGGLTPPGSPTEIPERGYFAYPSLLTLRVGMPQNAGHLAAGRYTSRQLRLARPLGTM